MIAETKGGNDRPSSEAMRDRRSRSTRLRWIAAQTPSGTPMSDADDRATTTVSSIVQGSTSAPRSITGWPVTSETPQSPRSAPARNVDVLLRRSAVEAEPRAQRVDRLAARLVAEDHLRRIARHDAHQHEHQRQHREQRDARRSARRRIEEGRSSAATREAGRAALAPGTRDGRDRDARHFVKRVFSVTGGDRLSEPCSS